MNYTRNATEEKCRVCGAMTRDWRPVIDPREGGRPTHAILPEKNKIPCCDGHKGAFVAQWSILTTASGRREDVFNYEWESWDL